MCLAAETSLLAIVRGIKVVAAGHSVLLLLPACGEKVGMRGLSASLNRAERAPHPDPLPAKSGARGKPDRRTWHSFPGHPGAQRLREIWRCKAEFFHAILHFRNVHEYLPKQPGAIVFDHDN